MNYIGSKHTLSNFIYASIVERVDIPLEEAVFCDLFAGTGVVGRRFKPYVKKVISNDIEYYSYVLNRNYIGNNQTIEYESYIEMLNELPPEKGFIYKHYTKEGHGERQYFSEINACKIDGIRRKIEELKLSNEIDEDLYFFLLASLIESADKVANTASVYGAYLKHLKKSAQKEMQMVPASFDITPGEHEVYQQDSNQLISKIHGDILYLDPPYNHRQYGANYHLLNTIAYYDEFEPRGKTGLRDYIRSDYCKKNSVTAAFEELIKRADFKYIFLSYNNEGLMSEETVKSIMQKYGKYSLNTCTYQRFKADKCERRNHKASFTVEYLHILEK